MAQWRSTNYTEHAPDSPNEKWGWGSSSFSRTFDLVDGSFQGRLQAAYDLLGYSAVVKNPNVKGAPYYITRVTPMCYGGVPAATITPAFSTFAPAGTLPPDLQKRFYVVGISRTQPLGQPKGVNLNANPAGTAAANYARARLTVELSNLPYLIKEDSQVLDVFGVPNEGQALQDLGWASSRYISRHIEAFSRLLKIPYGVMMVRGKLMKVALPVREGGANINYTWYQVPLEGPVPGYDAGRIGSMLGMINGQSFDGYAAGTLLLDSFTTREYQNPFGNFVADVTFKMIYLPHPSTGANRNGGIGPAAGEPQGWNSVYDVVNKIPDYYPVTAPDGVTPPFTSVAKLGLTFADLFRPADA